MINDIIQFLKSHPQHQNMTFLSLIINSLISHYEYICQSSISTSEHTLPTINYTEHRTEGRREIERAFPQFQCFFRLESAHVQVET